MKKKVKFLLLALMAILLICSCSLLFKNNSKQDIDKVLKGDAYSYLSPKAKEYIKEIYEKTGNILLTEKNKKENTPYLNPQYIDYLELDEEEKKKEGNIPVATIVDYMLDKNNDATTPPSSYDLRNVDGKNYITPVRNQGSLGICWTFALAGAAESYLLKQNDLTYQSNSLLISERQMDYATSVDGIKDYDNEYVSFIERNLGEGGNIYISSIAMANGISLIDYNTFKEFNDRDLEPMELNDILSYKNSLYELNSTINMPYLNDRESTDDLTTKELFKKLNHQYKIKNNIINYGAAYVSTNVNNSCVYTDSKLNNVVVDVYKCSTYGGGHAMEIIGWDDNIEYSYCADKNKHVANTTNCSNIVKGKGVWILKNSWGDNTQYPYLTYDSLYTGVSFITEMSKTSEKNWDNNYILGLETQGKTNGEYKLSDTKIKKTEKLKKIKFIGETSDTTYTIKILKNDGTYENITKNVSLPGLFTVDIDTDVLVDKDSKFFIETEGSYIDKISIFTENVDDSFYIDMEEYNNKTIYDPEIRLYSNTKNIPSGSKIEYKIYDESNNDLSDNISYSNNIVAENNVNTLLNFKSELISGSYRLDVLYNSMVIGSINFKYSKMNGSGTKDDPYVITNSSHLNQIRNDLDGYYVLANDIDLTADTREGGKFYNQPKGKYAFLGGHGWEPIMDFKGTLDGKGYKIKGLYQKSYLRDEIDDDTYMSKMHGGLGGLFGTVQDNVEIKNLTLENFDITCGTNGTYGTGSIYCGTLLAKYDSTNRETNGSTGNFENIFVKNSKLTLNSSDSSIYAGGVFGTMNSAGDDSNYKINISNIYIDLTANKENEGTFGGYLAYMISAHNVNIKNIQIVGQNNFKDNIKGILAESVFGTNVSISNIFSSVYDENTDSNLINWVNYLSNYSSTPKFEIKNINMLNIPNHDLFSRNDNLNEEIIENINQYERGVNSYELINKDNYSNWEDFDNNWTMKSVDGVSRYPVLKGVDFDYTKIDDININQELNKKYSIYDYVYPKTNSAKRIIFKVKDDSIVKIDDNGIIVPQKTGKTTIHVESFYDGYIKDVPINIEYVPHYTVLFDANGGNGTMNSVEVEIDKDYKINKNIFYKEKYEFMGWNTKADGSGTSYDDLATIKGLKDNEQITLYAQWRGEEFEITFDPNGGITPITSKKVRYSEEYGEFPVPTKDGCGFKYWQAVNKGNLLIPKPTTSVYYSEYYRNFTAEWQDDAYTIVFKPNGGNGYTKTSYSNNNKDHKLESNEYTRIGYKFNGWNTKADGSGTTYEDNEVINLNSVENSQLLLYAKWLPINYKIKFNSNEAKGEMEEQNLTYDKASKLNKNIFTKDGYKFKNWNTKADGSGTTYEDEHEVLNLSKEDGDIIELYAQWQEDFDFKINKYSYDETNNYIDLIEYNTTVSDFKKNIILNSSYSVTVDSKEINGKNMLFTGGKTKIFKDKLLYKELTNIVRGDVNGNGKIDIIDYIRIKKDIMDDTKLSGEYKRAADMNQNNKIDIIDYIRIKKIIMEAE